VIAAIYARKSTEQPGIADEQKSVTRQIDHARTYAMRKAWTVDEAYIYVDDGISGAEFANRPGFLRLMNGLKPRPPFQVLVMSEESRLGRESIETAYALKQIVQAGVRVFFYLEDRERTLDSPTDKIMLSLTAFADELEREKARQRTRDAMLRKAQAGHVTGGRCFGYSNCEILGGDGRRSHVERAIMPAEADVIRRIFRLSADGYGLRAIAKILNAEQAPAPRAQRGRPQSWAPTSVREVLHRPLYRGEIVWARSAKRDKWGQTKQSARPETDWIRRPAPELRIVTEDEWQAAHRQLDGARRLYLRATGGQAFGRPAVGNPSPYLLTNLALCGCCGGPLWVRSRKHGTGRKFFYGCSSYHNRGVGCSNGADVPMADANGILIEALLDDVLDEGMLTEAVDCAVCLVQSADNQSGRRTEILDGQIDKVRRECERLVSAIAAGGDIPGLVTALREREAKRAQLESERRAFSPQRLRPSAERLRSDLLGLADSWRKVLAGDPTHARPIVSSLLKDRVTYTPIGPRKWQLSGHGDFSGLFKRVFTCNGGVPNGIHALQDGIAFTRLFRAA
jgi:DNA invertase Pin-like site-specific DNA recombinase